MANPSITEFQRELSDLLQTTWKNFDASQVSNAIYHLAITVTVHLIFPFSRPTLAGARVTVQPDHDRRHESVVAQRPANRFRPSQRGRQGLVLSSAQQGREVAHTVENRCGLGHPVSRCRIEMPMYARPAPVRSASRERQSGAPVGSASPGLDSPAAPARD